MLSSFELIFKITEYMYLICLFIAIIALYFICAPRYADWLYRPILFPRKKMDNHNNPPVLNGFNAESVIFRQPDGNDLCAWYYRHPKSKYTMLVSHGNYGNMLTHSYLAEALLAGGYSVFIYDYSGYGASTGVPDLPTITNDAEAAYDYLTIDKGVKADNIILYGESIGASITAHLAAVRNVRAIILQSGFSSLRAIATETFMPLKLYPRYLFPDGNLDTKTNIARVRAPILVLHGALDNVVPFHHAQIIFDSAWEPKQFSPFLECDHRNISFADRSKFIKVIDEFIDSLLKRSL